MRILQNLNANALNDITIISDSLIKNADELDKYAKKTPENIHALKKLSNLVSMLTMFNENYCYETEKVEVVVRDKILKSIQDYNNVDRAAIRKTNIVGAVVKLCNAVNEHLYGVLTESKIKAGKSQKLKFSPEEIKAFKAKFYADYTKYVRDCKEKNDYKNSVYSKKAAPIYNIDIQHLSKKFNDEKSKFDTTKLGNLKVDKFGSDEQLTISLGQLNINKEFENLNISIYNGKFSITGAIFGHDVNFEIGRNTVEPVQVLTKIRPAIEPKPADQLPERKPKAPVFSASSSDTPEKKALADKLNKMAEDAELAQVKPKPAPTPVVEPEPEPVQEEEQEAAEHIEDDESDSYTYEEADEDELDGVDDEK
jgi:hypothetical protein